MRCILWNEEFQQLYHRTQERCQQFCDLTPGCTFWTWYKVHCDKWGLDWNLAKTMTMIIAVCLFFRLPCMGDEFTKRQVVLSKENQWSHHWQKHQRCAMLWSPVIWSFRSVMAAPPEQGWVLMMLCIGNVLITIWRIFRKGGGVPPNSTTFFLKQAQFGPFLALLVHF